LVIVPFSFFSGALFVGVAGAGSAGSFISWFFSLFFHFVCDFFDWRAQTTFYMSPQIVSIFADPLADG
jgi:hypothetical protein